MSGLLSYVPIVNQILGSGSKTQAIRLPPVEVHHVETNPDKRARCLKHLLKANHANYSIVYHNLQFDNHTPHILSSAYLLGANVSQLNAIYDEQITELEPWVPSPAEVCEDDWQDLRGDRRYQRAYVDFFEDQLAMQFSYHWKQEMEHYMFMGDEPLVNNLIGGRMSTPLQRDTARPIANFIQSDTLSFTWAMPMKSTPKKSPSKLWDSHACSTTLCTNTLMTSRTPSRLLSPQFLLFNCSSSYPRMIDSTLCPRTPVLVIWRTSSTSMTI
jgi:hypothetical protein